MPRVGNREEITASLPEGDALLVVPPFASLKGACLGAHVLQACAREAGFRVPIFYANLSFAARIGERSYARVAQHWGTDLGERIFAAAAYGTPPLDRGPRARAWPRDAQANEIEIGEGPSRPAGNDALEPWRVEEETGHWVEEAARCIGERAYRVVGATTMFEQTAASVALLGRVKKLSPSTFTILGGARCDGEMADGIATLDTRIDAIFSGECESAFTGLLLALGRGERLAGRIIRGERCRDPGSLPAPIFSEFFEQRDRFLPVSDEEKRTFYVPYETSRGCWWAERAGACRFCAFQDDEVRHRVKPAGKIVEDLKTIVDRAPTRRVRMADSVLPPEHVPALMARLGSEIPSLELLFEVRTTLSLPEVLALRRGGVRWVQAGVEALSTSLLGRMGKGVTARRNLAFLRYARIARIGVAWNLLWGFPGDEASQYEETLDLIPRIRHLPPPAGLRRLQITRFSEYFENPVRHGITGLRPHQGEWGAFLPAGADVEKIAWRFDANFQSGSIEHVDVIPRLHEAVRTWRASWETSPFLPLAVPPVLAITREAPDRFRLSDTRGLAGTEPESVIDRRQAEHALVARPFEPSPEADRAVRASLAVVREGWLVPLATAETPILLELESAGKSATRDGGP